MSFHLSSSHQAYLKRSLDLVSRSFALVIPQISMPLNDYLATAYLICRVVDNIEDTRKPYSWQQARFAEFAYLLNTPEAAIKILKAWNKESWPGLTADERRMMGVQYGLPLWQIYASLPQYIQGVIAHWIGIMAQGMEQGLDPDDNTFFTTHQNTRLPVAEADYNHYCYSVAGTVGRMATELLIHHYGVNGSVGKLLLNTSEICGRALQKTNIVKDFPDDLKRGFSYLPKSWLHEIDYTPLLLQDAPLNWKLRVLNNVLDELDNSAEYVTNLPHSAAGYRQACLLAMFPAYQTLLQAAQQHQSLFTAQHQAKISRVTMAKCVSAAKNLSHDNQAIVAYGRDIRLQVDRAFGESNEW